MASLIRILAIVVLAIIVGAASVYFRFFPGNWLSMAFTGLSALQKQQSQQSNEFNRGAIFLAKGSPRGVSLRQEGAYDGYTIFTTGHGDTVALLDMSGEPVHEWRVSYSEIWDNSGAVQNPVPARFIYIRKAKPYPDGRLLVIFSAWSTTPYGYGIAMLDRDSNVLWKDFRHIHHSFDQADNGPIYALDQYIESDPLPDYPEITGPYLDDGIAAYGEDGEFLGRFSILQAFHNSDYRDVITFMAAKNSGQGLGDLFHANDVEVLRADMAEKFPFAKAGDLLLSLRQIDSIALIDPAEEKVKWFRKGYWRRQHDSDFLPNGNLLIFDNFAMRSSASGASTSRVIEFDPDSMQIVDEYRAENGAEFFTPARGSQQRLPNGNTLITESHKSRIFEVTPEADIVWEYFNSTRLGENENLVPGIFWAERYSRGQLPFLSDSPSL